MLDAGFSWLIMEQPEDDEHICRPHNPTVNSLYGQSFIQRIREQGGKFALVSAFQAA